MTPLPYYIILHNGYLLVNSEINSIFSVKGDIYAQKTKSIFGKWKGNESLVY